MTNEIKILLKGLNCANCANKIEAKVNALKEINEANINFSLGIIIISINEKSNEEEVINKIKKIVKELEPDVVVSKYKKNNNNLKMYKSSCKEGDCCSTHYHLHESHGHSHSSDNNNHSNENHSHSFEKKDFLQKNSLAIIGILLYIIAMFFKEKSYLNISLFILSYALIGENVLRIAFKNILRGEVFDENFLMSIATLGALVIGQYPEAVGVMIFYKIGELFQGYAVNKSRKSITSLMNIRPEYANLLTKSGERKVSPEEVKVNDIIIIKPGERVALDGIIFEGEGAIDTSALTGESMPREVYKDDEILSGSINLNSVIKVKVNKSFGESTISRILEMVENASNKKAPTEQFITKFSRVYTPIVVFLALAVAIIPPIIVKGAVFSDWIYRALIFLVISCPCALVVSVPLGLFAGIGGASKKGVLVKGGNYLEALKKIDTVVFDKTGTLTKGVFKVTEINSLYIDKDELLKIVALAESFSNHPIAQSIVKAYKKQINKEEVSNYEELSGHGIKATIQGKEVILGNYKLMKDKNIDCEKVTKVGTVVYVSINGVYNGNIVIADEVKDDSKESIKKLKALGINKIVMLTGDSKLVAEQVAIDLGVDDFKSELLPVDKVVQVENLIKEKKSNGKLIFVGDGINDAPVLARADIGVAMGGIGSDAAIEAADVILMKDNPLALVDAIKAGRKTNKILWQNIIFSLGIKIIVLILGTFGLATMWEAVFADVGVTLIAVLNSMRALKI
ncbi:heavy metal translocating P-type ATPase [Clostridium uliginosum]|uniref:Cd2+/Zn2+-exporting ATPase n=1 Tax=Clostridium uliginosum TaxID=119641 RepID=A0A1I1J8T0_9CLOT|nr:heavy metal translocating P-type ATPase [Clostridium uliginosum]SFC43018.1 Cd2+/Zn2+-exporting ATPase [Clostridium uliginosum]